MIRELFYAQKYAATAYNSSAIRTVPSATEFHRFGLQAGSWAVTTGMEFHQFSKMCNRVIEYEDPAAMRGQ